MDTIAKKLVLEYIQGRVDKSEDVVITFDDIYTVWKAKVLQNWKFLISTTLPDGMYYELTYNGDKQEWYLDAYKKWEHQTIHMDRADVDSRD